MIASSKRGVGRFPQPIRVGSAVVYTIAGMGKSKVINLRIAPEEHAAWDAAAEAAGLKLSEWIRRRCNGTTTIEAPPPAAAPKPKKKR